MPMDVGSSRYEEDYYTMNEDIVTNPVRTWGPNRVRILNCTGHRIDFICENGVYFYIPPCGIELSAVIEYVSTEVKYGVDLVKVRFVPGSEEEKLWVEGIEKDVLIVGSAMAAQAYPGRVVAMIPSSYKRMGGKRGKNPLRFAVYGAKVIT